MVCAKLPGKRLFIRGLTTFLGLTIEFHVRFLAHLRERIGEREMGMVGFLSGTAFLP